MRTLLVIDDEQNVCYSFQRVFEGDQTRVLTAHTGAQGLALVRETDPDVILLDVQLPDGSGLEFFPEIQKLNQKRPVIVITAHGTTQTAIEAMKKGAFDYLVKPLDLERLSIVVERAFDAARLMAVPALLPDNQQADQIIGRSHIMQEMCKSIGRIAPQDVNVLILGESGTGKELVARALYHHSVRSEKTFLAINCAAIPENLLESELFGHEQGAFTGATKRRIGKFEQCNGGTLFLDEIGDMPPSLQAKMLRVLQDQQFERVGSNETIKTQVRVLAATNQDLEKLVQEGKFRKDLYFRLKVITIRVPPLRDHLDDLAELAHYFLFRYNRELGLNLQTFAPEALIQFQKYAWPGNVRELQSTIKQAMLNATGNVLLPEFLPEEFHKQVTSELSSEVAASESLESFINKLILQGDTDLYRKVMDSVERMLLPLVLRHTRNHQAQASEILGLNRTTLRYKLKFMGLSVDKNLGEEQLTKSPDRE